MGPRWGFGPVFANEWLTTSRRWQVYAGRALFVGVLLVGLWSVWVSRTSGQTVPTIHLWAQIGEGFFNAIVFTQLGLVLLAAPAATAGTICQDRSSGRLAQLLATDLFDAEIVLGKLGARLVPVVGLVACALPALAICVLMGGVDPLALAGAFLITVCLGIFACALTLAFSVWAAKPYEAILATYAFFVVWLLAIPTWDNLGRHWGFSTSPDWLIWSHPFCLAFAPYAQPGKVGVLDYFAFGAAMLICSSALLALVIGRMRAVVAAEGDSSAARLAANGVLGMSIVSQRTGGRSDRMLDQSPVLWYETQRKQHTPWIRAVLGLYFLLAILFTVLAILDSLWIGRINRGWLPAQVAAFLVAFALPLLLLSATMSVIDERGRGSLDILLVTPVATRSIVLAKWWGAFRELRWVLVLPILIAGVEAWINDTWPLLALLVAFICAQAAFWTSVGLALSTWSARLGRAFAVAVVAYAMVGLGWPVLVRTLFDGPLGVGLAAISPFYGSYTLIASQAFPRFIDDAFVWIPCWIAGETVIAAGLLLATLATFDRCLGRMTSFGQKAPRRGKEGIRAVAACYSSLSPPERRTG
jgi:ABC-type transport system involved in multi-copper enzyme maturation permease subunit